jgi:hypothetical protein
MIKIPEILPIRFYESFDGLQFQPFKNIESTIIKGNEWLLGETIKLQFEFTSVRMEVRLYNSLDNTASIAISTDVTPATWTTTYIHLLEFTPTELGSINFDISFIDDGQEVKRLYSDCLNVNYRLENYMKVVWSNTENKDGIVYNLDSGNLTFTTFVRGSMFSLKTEGEFETMQDADGQKILLKSTQEKVFDFKAWLLNSYQAVQMSLVSGCDLITIDGNSVLFGKPIAIEPFDQLASYELEGDAYENNWDYIELYEEIAGNIATTQFLTITLGSDEYFYTLNIEGDIRYTVNDSSPIYDTGIQRDVIIEAAPSSVIKVYASMTSSSAAQSSGGVKAVIEDVTGLTSLQDLFSSGNDNLKEITINADLSSVTNFNQAFANCISLEEINGIKEDSFDSAINIESICEGSNSLKEFTIFMPTTVSNSDSAFLNCTSLEQIRGNINTILSTPANFVTGCDNLIYPLKSYADTFGTGLNWWHPLDCDMTLTMRDSVSSFGITSAGSGLNVYTSSSDVLSTVGYYTTPGIDNILIGINLPSACSYIYFNSAQDNISEMVIDTLQNVSNIKNFLKDFKNIDKILIKNILPNLIAANYAFKNCRAIPNYFNVPNLQELYGTFENTKADYLSIVTTTDLYECRDAFKNAEIIKIIGTLNTTSATYKDDMFVDNTGMQHPTSQEKIDLMSASGYLYNY